MANDCHPLWPKYSSPEQVRSLVLDQQTDVYSVAAGGEEADHFGRRHALFAI